MTCAVSGAVREGAEAVVCASTGNTAASLAAYAARGGLRGAVIVPEGKIATGKLAQALMHGARVVALRGNFDQALELVRELAARHPVALVNSVNPFRLEGQKTAAFEVARGARRSSTRCAIPVGNAGNVTAYWKGFQELGLRAADARLPGRRGGAAGPRGARREARDRGQRDPHRQPGALGGGDGRPDRLARARRPPSPTRRSSRPTAGWPRTRASSASRPAPPRSPGCCATGDGGARRVVCVLTGHGLKDPQTALDQAGARRALRRPSSPRSRTRCSARDRAGPPVKRRRLVRVPASSANLGPGFDALRRRAGAAPRARGRRDGHVRGRDGPGRRPRRAQPRRARLRHACTRRTASPSGSAPRSRSAAGSGRAPRRTWPGLLAADHIFELDADVLALATALEGHPDNVAAALQGGFVVCADGRGHALRRPGGAGGRARRAPRARADRAGARRAARRGAARRRRLQRRARRAARARPRPRRLGPRLARPARPPAPAPPRGTSTRARWQLVDAAQELGALGATISGAGPTVLVWCHIDQTGASSRRCGARRRAGPTSCGRRSSRRAPTCASSRPRGAAAVR